MISKEEGYISETGNWNVASEYAHLKIMKPLWLADEYELIATFGTIDFIDEFNKDIPLDSLKIKGFQRLVQSLIMLINNTYFAIKEDRGRDKMEEYRKELEKIYKVIPKLYSYKQNQIKKTKEIIINIDPYEKILERVIELKALINKPLNQNHLIFTERKEFDPRAFKEYVKDRMINHG